MISLQVNLSENPRFTEYAKIHIFRALCIEILDLCQSEILS